ncbi:SDR family oxidoreductase [Microlunatus elymi]|uniref:SDR family oxidoreductase n=1 Tax=Microlunatus elymi TaxID=2596828 RepID=A0A516Q225_9ACTN|nr:SDR family oxidoreductase [Microlunatus elymi]QDP97474.1 SDR family oxidoreductase [Microlunatus elymi]
MSQVVAITGASAGVGRAVARLFAERGARVALMARGEKGLAAAAEDVSERGGEPMTIGLDVSDAQAVVDAVNRIEERFGPIDVWVNAAFTGAFARLIDLTPQEFRRATEVTYLGYVHGTMAALKPMVQRNRGTIVQVGSALAYRGIPLQSAYCGAKHAIQGFTESLRCELLHDRSAVRVTMVQLPAVNTPQFSWLLSRLPKQAQPVPPIYQPEVAARAIVFAADHPQRREYWVGRSTMLTLLANKIAPGLLDRYLARTGFSGQQTDQPRDEDQPANLWHPADGEGAKDWGAHGIFDDRARDRAPEQWVSEHRRLLLGLAGTAAAAGAGAAAVLGRRPRRRTAG